MPTVALLLALASVAAGCIPPSEPAQNGRLPDSALTTITPSCRIANDLAGPLRDLMWDGLWAGVAVQPETETAQVDLIVQPPELTSCYRSYDMQVWWRNYYCFFGACGYAAVPGTSIHGWGHAVDFQDLTGRHLTFTSPGYQWLKANAARYGFFHPDWAEPGGSSPEPWHWEHR